MKVEQVYTLMNTITKELTGQENVVAVDLSNIVDVGKTVLGTTDVDKYVGTLTDKIGKMIFDDRQYNVSVPTLIMDKFEYGSVIQKIRCDIPDASTNSSWGLTSGSTYSQDVFYQPTVSAKFFNSKVTFEVDLSFTERQVKSSFNSPEELTAFVSMLYNSVEKSLTIKLDGLIMDTINNAIAETSKDTTGLRKVNLSTLYKTLTTTSITTKNFANNQPFLRFAVMIMNEYSNRLTRMSTLFNAGGKTTFTPKENQRLILLSNFANTVNSQLYTSKNDIVNLTTYDVVPYWQGSGKDYSLSSCSTVKTKSGSGSSATNTTVSGVMGVLFDENALGVANLDKRVTTSYNAKAEFFNNYFKLDCSFFNDFNENFVIFVIDEPAQS